ncbi:hypothetical protein TSMEX_009091, partial [Taenia solium]
SGNKLRTMQHCSCLPTPDASSLLVFGRDIHQHKSNPKLVLDRLQDAELTLNPKNCRFHQRSINFHGHVVSPDGVTVNANTTQSDGGPQFPRFNKSP